MSSLALFILITTLVTDFFFGAYVNIALQCTEIFWFKYKNSQVNYFQFTCFVLLTILCTIKVVVDNFVTVINFTKPLPVLYIVNTPTTLLVQTIWVAETTVADAFIIYRLWIIWGKQWKLTILPMFLISGCIALGVYTIVVLSRINELELDTNVNPFALFARMANIWIGVTLALNFLCTGLIAYRIFNVHNEAFGSSASPRGQGSDPVRRVLNIIIESAAVYTTLLIVAIITSMAKSPSASLFAGTLPPIIAIVFGSIIVRSGSGISMADGGSTQGVRSVTTTTMGVRNSFRLSSQSAITSGENEIHHTGPPQVKLERVIPPKIEEEEEEEEGCITCVPRAGTTAQQNDGLMV